MTSETDESDLRLIEHGFPCHQVGAQTRRERGPGNPPTHRLHVWWARRPLTASRAAVIASEAPATKCLNEFLCDLGIERNCIEMRGGKWVIPKKLVERISQNPEGEALLKVDGVVQRAFVAEKERRSRNRSIISELRSREELAPYKELLDRWEAENTPISTPNDWEGSELSVIQEVADPDFANARIDFETIAKIRTAEDKYGYSRAFTRHPQLLKSHPTIVDLTAGGGSIPFEALRLGAGVVANELNPVATLILHATLDYPARFGSDIVGDILRWGSRLRKKLCISMDGLFPPSRLLSPLEAEEPIEELDGFIFCRTVICPHCENQAPLLNTCWLSKTEGERAGVRIVPQSSGGVKFEPFTVRTGGKGPGGEDPERQTVVDGVGQCVHCNQAIVGDEIKSQARGESKFGKWKDTLYCVVAVRYVPQKDSAGNLIRLKSGANKGKIKTKKVRFFRSPNDQDFTAIETAEKQLSDRWDNWEDISLIPTEKLPEGDKTREPIRYGMPRWCDLFTSRQLLGHMTLIEELREITPSILEEHGVERGKAIITYLQFAIDKSIDYNSRQTRWHFSRGLIVGAFGRHDFSLKWTFGETVFTGEGSGFDWALKDVVAAYEGITQLAEHVSKNGSWLKIINGSAASISELKDGSVDIICFDPPYYNNVQYAELSDYFYVWHRRTLREIYPDLYGRRLTNKRDEAVANPVRDGSSGNAKLEYERLMGEILAEATRLLTPEGIMTMMFTHKTQEAWEALTQAIIENGWNITAAFPVDSESHSSLHQKDIAAAASSIFIACRKRPKGGEQSPATWSGFGGTGVAERIRESVREGLKDFASLRLNPVDEMVASYGRALRVLSENWPVLDGDEPVTPIRAMNEASRVVAENQITRITKGHLSVGDLSSEGGMCLTLFGIFGHAQFPYDEALNLSKSLNISLTGKGAGYEVGDDMIGINTEAGGRGKKNEDKGYFAPLLRKGSKLRLALPEERNERRISNPQTEWDVLHGILLAFRDGGEVVARSFFEEHSEGRESVIVNLLKVWEAEIGDQKLQKEARAVLFGLGATQ